MKMIKALKKLKLWSRKKQKYRLLPKEYEPILPESPPPPSRPPPPPPSRPPPPPPYYPEYEARVPSAPPLPPWLECDLQFQETSEVSLDNSIGEPPDFPPPPEASCYRKHMDYDDSSTTQVAERRRGGGCVFNFALHLLRSVFPCFHIPEEPTAVPKLKYTHTGLPISM
ncbi:hypothetical protein ACS0TY_002937 [Phlomoides rotata]